MALTTYYDILRVSPRASDEEVHKAFRTLALRWHPDQNPRNRARSEEQFRRIHRAYLVLKTQERRNVYNRVLLKYLRSPAVRRERRQAVNANRIGFLPRFSTRSRQSYG
jgi:curved DNA-binding protein CbpA